LRESFDEHILFQLLDACEILSGEGEVRFLPKGAGYIKQLGKGMSRILKDVP